MPPPAVAPTRRWEAMTTVEAAAIGATDPVVVLPVAAIEQHGPHLPLGTDVEIGQGLVAEALARLPADDPVLVLPAQVVGTSLEHGDAAGTLTVDTAHLVTTICAVAAGVAACGVRRLVISNSHGGNGAAVDTAALRIRARFGMLVVKASYYRFARPDDVAFPEAEWRHGLHGGAVETAMMRYLRPDLVRTDRLDRFTSLGEALAQDGSCIGPSGAVAFAWLARDLNPTGAVGDATLGTAERGRRLVAHYGAALATVIRDARRFPVDGLGLVPR